MAFDLEAFTRADAGLVVAQLSYRAQITRSAPPFIHKLVDLYGPFGDGGPEAAIRWTDQRIAYAHAHGTVPDKRDSFPGRQQHTEADCFLTIARLAFRGGLTTTEPSIAAVQQRHGDFTSRGAPFMLRWIDQRIREAIIRLRTGDWHA